MRSQSLLLVHAHPDDESIITGGLILRAREAGDRVIVVTCTGGEEGEVHNLDQAVRPRLAEVRERELRAACAILGVDRLELLGYRDSGMAGSPANDHPDSFHRASLDEVAGRLVLLLWAEQPDAVVTYGPDGTYGHPDHVKAHQATAAALDVLRREGWSPARTLWHAVPRSSVERLDGLAHPAMRSVGTPDGEITTRVDVRTVLARKRAAVAAHVSQNPPDLLTAMTGQVLEAMGGFEHFVSAGGRESRPPACDQEIVKSAAGSPSTTTW
jgi:N-acetyl-1-D-myo-inositol-2-amino-2-deoxy-alpha-D-glucopyranoside deacetylase